jgi:microcystin-dependent protein
MEPNYEALAASDGSGEPIRATVQSPGREKGSMVIPVNATTNWPNGTFIATTGTLLANGTLSPTTAQVFYGTADETNVTITSFAAGYTDQGNLTNDVVVIKPTTEWANIVQDAISNITPSGVMMPFAGATAPAGYLLAQGQAVSRTTYSALFTAISTTYGDGDGSTTFNVPNMGGQVPAGYLLADDDFGTLGGTGGSKDIMAHGHGVNDPGHSHGVSDPGHSHGHSWSSFVQASGTTGGGTQRLEVDGSGQQLTFGDLNINGAGTGIGIHGSGTGVSVDSSGSGANNLTPYLTVNYIIKT